MCLNSGSLHEATSYCSTAWSVRLQWSRFQGGPQSPLSPACERVTRFLTDHKRMVSTMVCGPFGGIYPYPSQFPSLKMNSYAYNSMNKMNTLNSHAYTLAKCKSSCHFISMHLHITLSVRRIERKITVENSALIANTYIVTKPCY
jgi:hypothetical protein